MLGILAAAVGVLLLDHGRLPDGKKIAEASTRELAAATKATRAQQGNGKRKSAEQVQGDKAARAAQALLRKRGARDATARAVKRDGEMWLHIEIREKHAKSLGD